MFSRIALTLLLLSVATPAAAASAAEVCAKAGTVERWNEGKGFTVLPSSGGRLFAMRLLGTNISMDEKSPRLAMHIDGVYYQFAFVPIVDFAGLVTSGDSTLLNLHAKWEFAHARKLRTPLDQLEDLGNKVRPAEDGLPATTFKLWRMHDIANTASQFYVSTVAGNEVVVMTAIFPPDSAKAKQFQTVFRHYAATLNWQACPAADSVRNRK